MLSFERLRVFEIQNKIDFNRFKSDRKRKKKHSLWLHDVRRQRRMLELVLGIQERVSVERYVGVVDALAAERVPYPFACHGGGHKRHDVSHAAGQLEHDHHERHRHPGDAPEHGRRPHHGVQARCDAVVARRAFAAEQPELGVGVGELFHADSNDASDDGAQAERGDEQAAGHLYAEGEDGHEELEDEGQDQQPDGPVDAIASGRYLYGGFDVGEVPIVVAGKEIDPVC